MSEASDIIFKFLNELPAPKRDAVREAMATDLNAKLQAIGSRFQLNEEQQRSFETECLMVLVDLNELTDLRDSLIAEANLSYETAVRLQKAFESEVVLPIFQDAERRPYASQAAEAPTQNCTGHSQPTTDNTPDTLYEDKFIRVTTQTLERGATVYPVNKIVSVTGPFQLPFDFFGGFLLNGAAFLFGLWCISHFTFPWLIVGAIPVLFGGLNVWWQFNRPWWIIVTISGADEMRVQSRKKDEVENLYRALRSVIGG